MEKIAEVAKIFLEKHLLPSVGAIVGAIVTFLFIPSDSWIVVKLGKTLFIILGFGIYFLMLQLPLLIRTVMIKIKELKDDRKQKEEEKQESINNINEYIDKLSLEDKSIIEAFVENNNKTLISIENLSSNEYHSLLKNINILHISLYNEDLAVVNRKKYWLHPRLELFVSNGHTSFVGLKQYKMKDDFFQELIQAYRIKGKLGNF